MKKLILILATTGLLASCTNNVAYINGESYDLEKLQLCGVDSVVVSYDPLFMFQDVYGNTAVLSTTSEYIIMEKGMNASGRVRYYAIK